MAGLLYRVGQFAAARRARPLAAEEERRLSVYLPEPALELFRAMPPGDQRHSLAIFQSLLAQGYRARPLLQAALLHDVAKARVGLVVRSIAVLLNAAWPRLLPRLASLEAGSWRYGFYLSLHHPELGARQAERAGLDPRAVRLIRDHQLPLSADGESGEAGRAEWLEWRRALKRLDDRN